MSDIRLAQYGGYIFLVRTVMTPAQVEMVQDSFRLVGRQSDEAARIFYDELFRIAPHLREIFPSEMSAHKTKFVQMLSTIIHGLGHITRLSDHVVDLGRRHMSYDVEDEHYSFVGDALEIMLERIIGPKLTPELLEAWRSAYDMLARVMREAAVVPSTTEGFYSTIIRSVLTSQYGISIIQERNLATRPQITQGIERGQVIRFS